MTPHQDEEIYKYQPLWGNWFIDMKIGKGSFGTVYKIVKEEMGHQYVSALKIISVPSEDQYREAEASMGNDENTLKGYFEDIVKNIVNEVNALYQLSGNSNIVNFHEHKIIPREDRFGWDVLIKMEYVTSLKNYMMNHPFTIENVLQMGIDICTALDLCAKRRIIHRDIKDENIFVNEDGLFKLGDFGISRELSKSGRALSGRGTPYYMAPEVYWGKKYDSTVDLYSLGLVLFKLLNYGRMPFMPEYPKIPVYSDNETAFERRMSGEKLPRPICGNEELEQLIQKACDFEPEKRFQKAQEMKKSLQKALLGMSEEELQLVVGVVHEKEKKKAATEENEKGVTNANDIALNEPLVIKRTEPKKVDSYNKTGSIFGNACEVKVVGLETVSIYENANQQTKSNLLQNDNLDQKVEESLTSEKENKISSKTKIFFYSSMSILLTIWFCPLIYINYTFWLGVPLITTLYLLMSMSFFVDLPALLINNFVKDKIKSLFWKIFSFIAIPILIVIIDGVTILYLRRGLNTDFFTLSNTLLDLLRGWYTNSVSLMFFIIYLITLAAYWSSNITLIRWTITAICKIILVLFILIGGFAPYEIMCLLTPVFFWSIMMYIYFAVNRHKKRLIVLRMCIIFESVAYLYLLFSRF